MKAFLGVDVGSVSTNVVILDEGLQVVQDIYLRTNGQPIRAVLEGLNLVREAHPDLEVMGAGTTGSGRLLTNHIIGADSVKNEITAHAVAALHTEPEARTVLEIGGQDSKIIVLRDGVVVDFAMNSVCAAGTGSFLDQQATRLGLPVEEFGKKALEGTSPVRIAGRCAVFAESDMIHKQQAGYALPDIIYGLCEALVRNYLNNVAKGKDIRPPVLFQGGVAANVGIRQAFEKALGFSVKVPKYYNVMGAIGAAILASEEAASAGRTKFKGFQVTRDEYKTSSFECRACSQICEIIRFMVNGQPVAAWGGRCERWADYGSARESPQADPTAAAGAH